MSNVNQRHEPSEGNASRENLIELNRQQQRREISNPTFFYNEDVFVQQAMQESLLDANRRPNARGEDEMFNQLLKETLVMSRKEFDDIDRK